MMWRFRPYRWWKTFLWLLTEKPIEAQSVPKFEEDLRLLHEANNMTRTNDFNTIQAWFEGFGETQKEHWDKLVELGLKDSDADSSA